MTSPVKVRDALNHRRRVKVKGLKLSRDFNYLEISRISAAGDYETVSVSPDDIPDRADVVLRNGDVAVSSVRPNRNAVAYIRDAKRLVGTSGLVVLRARTVLPEYLFAFTKTKHFAAALTRETTATMYPAVSADDILNVPFIMPTPQFAQEVQKTVRKSSCMLLSAGKKHAAAEHALLKHLGLHEWQPQQGGVAVKAFSNSPGLAGRWDAEYYRPKYDDIAAAIERHDYATLETIADIKKSIEPGSEAYQDSGIPFVRVADLSKFDIARTAKFLGHKEYGEMLKDLHLRKNSILFTKDGTVGIAYKMNEDVSAITSGAILHLSVRNADAVLPDYLALVLNSLPVQMQAERDSGGVIIQHWRLDDIKKISIPILPYGDQRALADMVEDSFALRARSKELLDNARQAVETAIEKGEKEALAFLEERAKK